MALKDLYGKNRLQSIFVLVLLLGGYYYSRHVQNKPPEGYEDIKHVSGTTMGKIQYNVKYRHPELKSFKTEIDSVLEAFNQELSTYIPSSTISLFNTKDTSIVPRPWFREVVLQGQEVFQATEGAFDPTVMPLVNAWGFGWKKPETLPDSATIDSLLDFVGYGKISLEGETLKKSDPRVMLDFSAIAKGYACDVVGQFLESRGVSVYAVEIGGEVTCRGLKSNEEPWQFGIRTPEKGSQQVQEAVQMKDVAMATSGNYENYKEVEGVKMGHTIDPKTGYPIQTDVLSATVVAKDCITADAYATALMVLGLEKGKALLESRNDLAGMLIYGDGEEMKTYISSDMEPLILIYE